MRIGDQRTLDGFERVPPEQARATRVDSFTYLILDSDDVTVHEVIAPFGFEGRRLEELAVYKYGGGQVQVAWKLVRHVDVRVRPQPPRSEPDPEDVPPPPRRWWQRLWTWLRRRGARIPQARALRGATDG